MIPITDELPGDWYLKSPGEVYQALSFTMNRKTAVYIGDRSAAIREAHTIEQSMASVGGSQVENSGDQFDLCDGCKCPIDHCCCDELATEYAEECGPVCDTCGGDMCEGYGGCVLSSLNYPPGQCRFITGSY